MLIIGRGEAMSKSAERRAKSLGVVLQPLTLRHRDEPGLSVSALFVRRLLVTRLVRASGLTVLHQVRSGSRVGGEEVRAGLTEANRPVAVVLATQCP